MLIAYVGKGSNLNSRANLTYRMPLGHTPWNKGRGREERQCKGCGGTMRVLVSQGTKFCSKKCFDLFQTHDKPKTYGTLHAWIRRNYGTPSECEHCGTTESKKFEWASISGGYLQDRSDWARLCCRCHRRYDRGTKNKIEVLNV